MAKGLKLLLIENVDSLGIVGDVVNVRLGYARNFLLPRNLATTPSDELIKSLAGKRADAEKQLAELRKHREQLIGKLQTVEVTLTRSCNDLGILYGAITQQDMAKALGEQGYNVKPREVRLNETIKRVGNYDVHVKLDSDLDATVKLHVKPDRELESREKPETKPDADTAKKAGEGDTKAEGAKTDGKPEAKAEGKPEGKREDRPRKSREDREDRQFRRRDAFMDNIPKEEKTGWAVRGDAAKTDAAAPAAKDSKKDKGEKAAKGDKPEKAAKKKGKE